MNLRFALLHILSLACGAVSYKMGLNPKQAFVVAIFTFSIFGSLFFWEFRLSFSFIGSVLLLSGFLSSMLDNVVGVAAYIPILQGLDIINVDINHLWWALLFGACYGGNITMIGSTANIVAIGILEKDGKASIKFRDWLKIGSMIGFVIRAGLAHSKFYSLQLLHNKRLVSIL